MSGGNTSMATEDLLINNGCDRQAVKAVCEGLPQLNVVPPLTCGRQPQLLGHNLIWRLENLVPTAATIASHQIHFTFYIILAL